MGMSDLISRQDVLDKFKALCDACGKGDEYNGVMCRCCYLDDGICIVEDAPTADQTMTIHEMACILDELFGNEVACNFNGLDEWLPEICKHKDKCPDVNSVLCWEQYLEHQMEKFNEDAR